ELDFQDVDVLGAGPVAGQSTASFETYWNSQFAVPITQLGKFAPDPGFFPATRARLRERCDGLRDSIHARALNESHLAQDLRADDLHVHWADARRPAPPPLGPPPVPPRPSRRSGRTPPAQNAPPTGEASCPPSRAPPDPIF